MSGIENTIIARIEKSGEKFEILVDPKLGYEYKVGIRKDLANVCLVDEVFKDANKGERHSPTAIKKAFGTNDFQVIAKEIFAHGELQLTTDQRRKLLEEKRAKIVAIIARNCVDPRTKAPHPVVRIENAMEQARITIEPFKSAEEQVDDIIEELREIIPISMEKVKMAVRIRAEHAPRAYGFLKEHGIMQEEWANDGSLVCVVEMFAGAQGDFLERLNKLTSGQTETKLLTK